MNSLFEAVNGLADRTLDFAWPMLWQSSLLIIVVFACDMALKRRLRASVRYGLWMVVLIKLLLPPSLALPSSPAWWAEYGSKVQQNPAGQTAQYVVTYGDFVQTAPLVAASPSKPPRPQLSFNACLMALWGVGILALFTLVGMRWLQVLKTIRASEPPPSELNELFQSVKRQLNWRRLARLRMTRCAMSPAVCGLFQPTILLPHSLVEKLEPCQLRAVLLHELIHLKRGDVWMNCAQALVQILYWWHPFVWVANARIRRLREEAVDDAVMLELDADREMYAPTLLEVARLAFSRPLASLGLVGILESRSALRQRVQRLIHFRAPRRAGLTLTSILSIAAFAVVAVPMGEAPERLEAPTSDEERFTHSLKVNPDVFIRNIQARASEFLRSASDDYSDILLDILDAEGVDCSPDGIEFNTETGEITTRNTSEQLRIFEEVIRELNLPGGERVRVPHGRKNVQIDVEVYKLSADDFNRLQVTSPHLESTELAALRDRMSKLGLQPLSRPGIRTAHGISASLFVGDTTNNLQIKCVPFVKAGHTELAFTAHTTGWFGNNPAGDWPTVESQTNRAISTRVFIEDDGGAVLTAKHGQGASASSLLIVLTAKQFVSVKKTASVSHPTPEAGALVVPQAATLDDFLSVPGTFDMTTQQLRFVHSVQTNDGAKFYTRHFKFDPDVFLPNLRIRMELPERSMDGEILVTLPKYLEMRGIPLDSGEKWFGKERGLFMVVASPEKLDAIESLFAELNGGRTQSEIPAPKNPPQHDEIMQALDQIQISTPAYKGTSLADVARDLYWETRNAGDRGMDFGFRMAGKVDLRSVKITAAATSNARLADALANVVKGADKPIRYYIWGGIAFFLVNDRPALPLGASFEISADSPRAEVRMSSNETSPAQPATSSVLAAAAAEAPKLLTRVYQVDPNTFYQGLEAVTGVAARRGGVQSGDVASGGGRFVTAKISTNEIQAAVRFFFTAAGVDLSPPKAVFFNDRNGTVLVRGTSEDLDIVETAIQVLNTAPPQVNVKVKFAQMDEGLYKWVCSKLSANDNEPGPWTSVVASPLLKEIFKKLNADVSDADLLTCPEMTTLSGRRGQIQVVDIAPIVTGARTVLTNGKNDIVYDTRNIPLGSVMDVVAKVSTDGVSMEVTAVPQVTEFLGYAPTDGELQAVGRARLRVRNYPNLSPAVVFDGQTLVLGNLRDQSMLMGGAPEVTDYRDPKKRRMLVFVTPTIIDPAGNRIHTDEEVEVLSKIRQAK